MIGWARLLRGRVYHAWEPRGARRVVALCGKWSGRDQLAPHEPIGPCCRKCRREADRFGKFPREYGGYRP